MRDGISVIALVVASCALIVSLAGLSGRAPEPETAPEELLEQAKGRLDRLSREREAMRKEIGDLRAKLTRAIELGAGGGEASGLDRSAAEAVARAAVDAALRRRLEEERKKVGAPEPKRTPQEQFHDMLGEIEKSLKFEPDKMAAVKAVLGRLRASLNRLARAHGGKLPDGPASQARQKTDRELAGVLTPEEFERFNRWRKRTDDSYARRFFGPLARK
jgi:hypothetical protein